jgi:hypothetical protein
LNKSWYSHYHWARLCLHNLNDKAWGHRKYGGAGAPSDKGYTKIYSNNAAFAALKADGSIASWGFSEYDIGVALTIGHAYSSKTWGTPRLD